MRHDDRWSKPRSLLVWLSITAGLGCIASLLLPIQISLQGSFDELLVRLCSWALLACGAWFWAASTAVVVSVLTAPTGTEPRTVRGVPASVRRLILMLCGAALAGGVAAPALATPGPAPLHGQDHSGRIVLTGLPFPERATKDQPAEHPRQRAAVPADSSPGLRMARPARAILVHEGDSLWSIAADLLPPGASNAEVANAWHALYALNQEVIGPDPDRIESGQRLILPSHLALRTEGASS